MEDDVVGRNTGGEYRDSDKGPVPWETENGMDPAENGRGTPAPPKGPLSGNGKNSGEAAYIAASAGNREFASDNSVDCFEAAAVDLNESRWFVCEDLCIG